MSTDTGWRARCTLHLKRWFRPDGGAFEQCWFHQKQATPDPGAAAGAALQSRIMFEIRIVEGGGHFDAFTRGVSHNQGRASVGTRINRVNYFRGAVREARFTPRALAPDAFAVPTAI